MSIYLSKSDVLSAIAGRFPQPDKYHADGADGLSSTLSSLIIAPVTRTEPLDPNALDGAVVAGIHVVNATEDASIQNGFYDLRLRQVDGSITAELVSNGTVVLLAKTTRLVPTAMSAAQPEAVVLEVTSAAVFLGGVVAGMCLAIYMLK